MHGETMYECAPWRESSVRLRQELDAAPPAVARGLERNALLEETIASSDIEGIADSASAVYLTAVLPPGQGPPPGTPGALIRSCRNALQAGLERRNRLGALMSPPEWHDVILAAHRVLMEGYTSNQQTNLQAGRFRSVQNIIANARRGVVYTPPPPERVAELMNDYCRHLSLLDSALHRGELDGIAAAHGRFEDIHPFVDGNGRVGRIIATLQLHATKAGRTLAASRSLSRYRSWYCQALNKDRAPLEGESGNEGRGNIIACMEYAVALDCDRVRWLLPALSEVYEEWMRLDPEAAPEPVLASLLGNPFITTGHLLRAERIGAGYGKRISDQAGGGRSAGTDARHDASGRLVRAVGRGSLAHRHQTVVDAPPAAN